MTFTEGLIGGSSLWFQVLVIVARVTRVLRTGLNATFIDCSRTLRCSTKQYDQRQL